jgi:hypothetical protein
MCDRDAIKFVELYESEPILWDPTLKNYTSRECRIASAKYIATGASMASRQYYRGQNKASRLSKYRLALGQNTLVVTF